MDYQRVVLGIGNPGAEYDQTRHNAGFEVLDAFAAREGLTFRRLERRKSEWFGPDGTKFGGKVKTHAALWRHPLGSSPDKRPKDTGLLRAAAAVGQIALMATYKGHLASNGQTNPADDARIIL